MFSSLGRKRRGNSLGKKGQAIKKGLKGLGGVALLGAGIYAAYQSHEKHHENDDELTKRESAAMMARVQKKAEEEHARKLREEAVPVPAEANAIVFADSGGSVSKLDKVDDILDVAKVGVDVARDVDEAEGKFKKAKAVAQGAKEVKDKVKNIGKKNKEQKLVEGELSEEQEAKMIKKEKKKARKQVSKEKCAEVFKATGKKGKALAPLRKLCEQSGF